MRIAAAMSGGVDSSVTAYELKKKGHEVIGVTIKTWPKESGELTGERLCCSLEAVQLARSVCEDLDIPFHVIDLSEEFAKEVAGYFMREYEMGRTPNPCIYCNSRIKFGYFLKKARELGAEKIATGHYARVISADGHCYLAEGVDKKKDQSYFLYDIPRETLASIEFPLGGCTKDEVRRIAEAQGFVTAYQPSSQDICFVSEKGDYRGYLHEKGVKAFTPGSILDTEGRVVGEHKGIAGYTVGQRKGLGSALGEPAYVIKIDPANNTIVVGDKEDAMHGKVRIGGINRLTLDKFDRPERLEVKIRYASGKAPAIVTPKGEDEAVVEFEKDQFAPTPGQAAVFYREEIVVGGGWIEEVL